MTNSYASNNMTFFLGADGVVVLLFFFAGLLAAWWALGALKWDKFVNQPLSPQVRMIRFFLSLMGGTLAVAVAILLLGAMQIFRTM